MADPAAVDFVLALGRALHRYGAPAHRLEEALSLVARQLGLAAEVFSTPTTIIARNLISGTARLMSAVVVLLLLAVGVAIGERLGHAVFTVPVRVPVPLPAWTQWAAVVAAALAVTVIVKAERRAIGWILGAALTAFVGTRYGTWWLGGELGVLVGALGLGVLANAFARWLDRPAQVVLVPATLILVPGSLGFRGMTSLLARDTVTGIDTVFAMFVVALAIATGLLMSNAVLSPRRAL